MGRRRGRTRSLFRKRNDHTGRSTTTFSVAQPPVCPERDPDFRRRLYDDRRQAAEERLQDSARNRDVDQSPAVLNGLSDLERSVVLFVSGMLSSSSPKMVVQAVEDALSCAFPSTEGALRRCQKVGRNCLLTVANRDIAGQIINLATRKLIVIDGRWVWVKKNNGKPRGYMLTSDNALLQKVNNLQIGWHYPAGDPYTPFTPRWETKRRWSLTLEVDPAKGLLSIDAESISAETNDFRIEIQMRRLRASFRHQPAGCFLLLKLDHPPSVYRRNMDSFSASISGGQQPLLWTSRDGETDGWVETIDTFSDGMLGFCLLYIISVPSNDMQKIVDYFKNCGLCKQSFVQTQRENSPVTELPPSVSQDGLSWSGSMQGDQLFKHSSFPIRYTIHCLVAKHRLDLSRTGTALLKAIREYREAGVVEALQEAVVETSGSFYKDPAKYLRASMRIPHLAGVSDEDSDCASDNSSHWSAGASETVRVRKVLVTPMQIYPILGELDQSNRILEEYRAHHDRFIRVSFVDQHFNKLFSNNSDLCDKRVRHLLRNGLVVGGSMFHFLAYSSSQLREYSCWFYNEDPSDGTPNPPTAEQIRNSVGDVSRINITGKRAARIGQALSGVFSVLALKRQDWRITDDIIQNGFRFTDGCGVVSHNLALDIADRLGFEESQCPSAFQVRMGGCKGMLSVARPGSHHTLGGRSVAFTASMEKFESESNDLYIINYSRALPFFLNRQVITLLEALGVPESSFFALHNSMIDQIVELPLSSRACEQLLRAIGCRHVRQNPLTVPYRMLSSGFDVATEPFLQRMMRAYRDRLLYDVRTGSRILVNKAVVVVGVADQGNPLSDSMLGENEVFVQFIDHRRGGDKRILSGNILVGRNPSLHPGDLRLLRAVDKAHLRHLVDVIVFPVVGERPVPDQMSGGDLDGDLYFCIWDRTLRPTRTVQPAEYKSRIGLAIQDKPGEVASDDITDFFVEFMKHDVVGRLANAHLVKADRAPAGALDHDCIYLSSLASIAVDFAKTGIKAVFPTNLRPNQFPDFMEKDADSYESTKVLGKLYRATKTISIGYSEDPPILELDHCLVLPGAAKFMDEANVLLDTYNSQLQRISVIYGIHNEGELLSGQAIEFSSESRRGKGHGDLVERLNREIADLRAEFRELFWDGLPDQRDSPDDFDILVFEKASAWYQACYEGATVDQGNEGDDSVWLSFPWVAYEQLCRLKTMDLQWVVGETARHLDP